MIDRHSYFTMVKNFGRTRTKRKKKKKGNQVLFLYRQITYPDIAQISLSL